MPGGGVLIATTNPVAAVDQCANGIVGGAGDSGGAGLQMVGGGGSAGSGVGGAFGRPGLPVVLSGTPPHPHGPLIRGNLVPRLLAPLQPASSSGNSQSGGGGVGGMPLYAIVKPQSQQGPSVVRQIGGGPPVHVCVPMAAHPALSSQGPTNTAMVNKLGPATAPGNTPRQWIRACVFARACPWLCFWL